jgi:hypothetical protein
MIGTPVMCSRHLAPCAMALYSPRTPRARVAVLTSRRHRLPRAEVMIGGGCITFCAWRLAHRA